MTELLEYRRGVDYSPEATHWFVKLGPIPDTPEWHRDIYRFSSYPFPSEEAARRFAEGEIGRNPGRDVAIRFPDGRVFRYFTQNGGIDE